MSSIAPFQVARLPAIEFGSGTIAHLPERIAAQGHQALLVTGRRSFVASPRWPALTSALAALEVDWQRIEVGGEPSPDLVDETVRRFHQQGIEVVVGIGGGSVLDAAKAIAGLLPSGASVMDHLEGVGRDIPYRGPAMPLIAVPTTAGTGSEATKNAVLSRRGPDGFKKSFRHEALVARLALVDPELLATCPPPLLAADGMDAFTQLLESWVSLGASPFSDALAHSGLDAFRDGFWAAWEDGESEGRERLAWASLCSGITLAQAGLGSVHGLASPLGAFFPIPHGVVCGTLVAEATAANIRALEKRIPDSPALTKYTAAAHLLGAADSDDDAQARQALVALLRDWVERLALPRLSAFGIGEDDLERIIAHSRGGSMRTNPLVLSDAELAEILKARL